MLKSIYTKYFGKYVDYRILTLFTERKKFVHIVGITRNVVIPNLFYDFLVDLGDAETSLA